jgi:hypothetical protein
MQANMNLSRTFSFTGTPSSPPYESLTTPYTDLVSNAVSVYSTNQINTIRSLKDETLVQPLDTLCTDFTDQWIGMWQGDVQSLPSSHPLSIPYIKKRFGLDTVANVSTSSSSQLIYLNATLFYLVDRFMAIALDKIGPVFGGESTLYATFSAFAQPIYNQIAAALFPLDFTTLHAAVDASAGGLAGPYIVSTFFKTDTLPTPASIMNSLLLSIIVWMYPLIDSDDAVGAGNALADAVAEMYKYLLEIEGQVYQKTKHVPEIPVENKLVTPIAALYAQYHVPELTFSDIVAAGAPSSSGSMVNSYPITTPPSIQSPYMSFDDLITGSNYIQIHQRQNYNNLYQDTLLNRKYISQIVGETTGMWMGGAIDLLLDSADDSLPLLDAVQLIAAKVHEWNSQFKKFMNNRPLLPLGSYRLPDYGSFFFKSISTIQSQYQLEMYRIKAFLTPSQALLVDTTIISNIFENILQREYWAVEDVYNAFLAKYNTILAAESWSDSDESSSKLISQISPQTLFNVINLSGGQNGPSGQRLTLAARERIGLTTLDYLVYLLSAAPDGGPTLPQRTDPTRVDRSAVTYRARAAELQRLHVELGTILDDWRENEGSGTTVPGGGYSWVDRPGHHMIEWVEVLIGGECYDRHSGDWLDVWYELTCPPGLERAYAKMIGATPELTTPSHVPKPRSRLTVPLQFWYCRNTGLYLPLVSMCHTQVSLRVKLRKRQECTVCPDGSYTIIRDRRGRPRTGEPRVSCSLQSRYIYLDKEERDWFAKGKLEYIFDYVQESQDVIVDSWNYADPDKSLHIPTWFQNPCKSLIWSSRLGTMERRRQWTAGGYRPCVCIDGGALARSDCHSCLGRGRSDRFDYGDTVASCKIKFNGTDREIEKPGIYWGAVQGARSWKDRSPRDGVYSYNFAFNPKIPQPTGSVNLSKIDDVSLFMRFHPGALSRVANGDYIRVKVWSYGVNVVRFMSGMAGRVFLS